MEQPSSPKLLMAVYFCNFLINCETAFHRLLPGIHLSESQTQFQCRKLGPNTTNKSVYATRPLTSSSVYIFEIIIFSNCKSDINGLRQANLVIANYFKPMNDSFAHLDPKNRRSLRKPVYSFLKDAQ